MRLYLLLWCSSTLILILPAISMSAPRKYVRDVRLKSMKQKMRMKKRMRVEVKNEKQTQIHFTCLFHSSISFSSEEEFLEES